MYCVGMALTKLSHGTVDVMDACGSLDLFCQQWYLSLCSLLLLVILTVTFFVHHVVHTPIGNQQKNFSLYRWQSRVSIDIGDIDMLLWHVGIDNIVTIYGAKLAIGCQSIQCHQCSPTGSSTPKSPSTPNYVPNLVNRLFWPSISIYGAN